MAKPGKQARSDGIQARQNLLACALRLFAEKGFARTSTREIALAAHANIGAISYYFGDKAGLYQAAFVEPMGNPRDNIALYGQPHLTLRQSLEGFYASFLEPIKDSGLVQQCVKLHFREMLEPTGVWQQEIDNNIKPSHMALVSLLCRHLGVAQADDDIHRLCFSIAGLGMMLHVAGDVFAAIRPQLVASPEALDVYGDRLLIYALALVEAERERRNAPGPVRHHHVSRKLTVKKSP